MGFVTERLLNAIKKVDNPNLVGFEDVRDVDGRVTAYPVPGGFAIGWGSRYLENNAIVQPNTVITTGRAEVLLIWKVNGYADMVDRLVTSQISQEMFEALVRLSYDIGEGAFRNSDLLKVVNANPNDLEGVKREFRRWAYINGQLNQGLLQRREEEIRLITGQSGNSATLLILAALVFVIIRTQSNKKGRR